MTKQKQIEDYPELDGFIGDNECGDANGDSIIRSKLVAEKLLEQQAKIDSLTERESELKIKQAKLLLKIGDMAEKYDKAADKIVELTEQNKEIESEYKELLWRNQKLEAFVAVVDYSGLAKTNQDIADTIELLNKESK